MAQRTRRPGRPRGALQDPAARRERLLSAAEDAICTFGPGVSMDQIAAHADVSRATVYDNFENRAEITNEIIERFGAPLLGDLVARLGTALPPEAIVRVGLATYLDHIDANPEIYRFVVRNMADDTLFRSIATLIETLVVPALLDRPDASEVGEELARAVLGAIISATERWSERRVPPREQFERTLGDFVWGGLVAAGVAPLDTPIDLASVAALREDP
jgi:AcrR family transcriptional regulator